MNGIIDRTGEKRMMNCGMIAEIILYKNNNMVMVRFEDGYLKVVSYLNFKKGKVKNPYLPTFFNVGYLGDEKIYKKDNSYSIWYHMLSRCYNEKADNYKWYGESGITVCEEWHNYSNFKKWYNENIYESDEKLNLDKDILIKGNKIYSPETCIFVPQRINILFREFENKFPTLEERSNGTFAIRIRMNGISKRISGFETKEKAWGYYLKEKQQIIKNIAEEYKDKIPNKLYDRLLEISFKINRG